MTRKAFAAEVASGEFDGEYYRVVEGIHDAAEDKLRLKVVSVSDRLEVGTITFNIENGASVIDWHDSDPDE